MLEAAVGALENLSSCPCALGIFPARLVFLFFGVLVGLSLGAIPGLGGIVGLAILLPFTFALDPYAAFAMMIGLISVTSTADTIPSVLFGVPGTVASQATILDGHPMAKKGEAGRAFGAAYTASLLGGLFGALVLALSIPILRPVVLAFGSPEFFMMGLLGISMVAVLSGGAPVKGLIAGAAGLTIGMIGVDPQAAFPRWAFDALYLWDGIPLVPVTLGIFAIPEIVDLAVKGTRIARGTADIRLAMQRKELDGACWGWESARVTGRALLDAKGEDRLIPILNHRRWEDRDVKDVPLTRDVLREKGGEEAVRLYDVWSGHYEFQRPLAVPPGTPKERLAMLRRAFADTMKDPAFLAEATKAKLELEYTSGEEIEEIVEKILAIPGSAKEKLRFLIPK